MNQLAQQQQKDNYNELTVKVAEQWRIHKADVFYLAQSFISAKENIPPEYVDQFLMVCVEHRLNPALKEIAAFYSSYKGLTTFVMIDGWVTLAHRHGQCDGWEFEDTVNEAGDLHSITCIMHRKDLKFPIRTTVMFKEWDESGLKNDGKQNQWDKKPHWMLQAKALKQSCRLAFGYAGVADDSEAKEIQGVSTAELMGQPLELAHSTEENVIDILAQMKPAEAPPEDEYRTQEAAAKEETKAKAAEMEPEPLKPNPKPFASKEEVEVHVESRRPM